MIKQISGSYPDFNLFKSLFKEQIKVIEKIEDIDHELPYHIGCKIQKPQVHLGQRKLLLSEIQFLSKVNTEYCLYAGAAPGNKTHYLSQLFPKIKFILIDPNKFNINIRKNNRIYSHREYPHQDIVHIYNHYPTRSNKYVENENFKIDDMDVDEIINFIVNSDYKIFIIEDYMTNYLAEVFSVLDMSFISDIRTNVNGTQYPENIDIYWNSAMQYNWMNIMRPQYTMLKMRMPFGKINTREISDFMIEDFEMSDIDFIGDYWNGTFNFSKAEMYIQAWSGVSSTEMRFHIERNNINNIVEYNIDMIESKFNYYNSINRGWIYHENTNSNNKFHFCHCNDCALENKILSEFDRNTLQMVKEIDFITNQPLKKRHTNNIFKVLNKDDRKNKLYKIRNVKKRNFNSGNRGERGKDY